MERSHAGKDAVWGRRSIHPFEPTVPSVDMRTRPVDDERLPRPWECRAGYYGAVEMAGPPLRIERIFGRSCGDPECQWQEIKEDALPVVLVESLLPECGQRELTGLSQCHERAEAPRGAIDRSCVEEVTKS